MFDESYYKKPLKLNAARAWRTYFGGGLIDALHGMLAGGICGAVVLPLYAPAFALPGLICGVLWPVGGFFALGLGIASGAVWSAFVGE